MFILPGKHCYFYKVSYKQDYWQSYTIEECLLALFVITFSLSHVKKTILHVSKLFVYIQRRKLLVGYTLDCEQHLFWNSRIIRKFTFKLTQFFNVNYIISMYHFYTVKNNRYKEYTILKYHYFPINITTHTFTIVILLGVFHLF